MVTRILKYESTVTANATDEEMDSKSPGSGKQFQVEEVYGDDQSSKDYSIVYEERKLMDNVPGNELADEDNGIPFSITVGESEDLTVLASNSNSSDETARFYVRVDETGR